MKKKLKLKSLHIDYCFLSCFVLERCVSWSAASLTAASWSAASLMTAFTASASVTSDW